MQKAQTEAVVRGGVMCSVVCAWGSGIKGYYIKECNNVHVARKRQVVSLFQKSQSTLINITSGETYRLRPHFLPEGPQDAHGDDAAGVHPCPCSAVGVELPIRLNLVPQVRLVHLAQPCGSHALLELLCDW